MCRSPAASTPTGVYDQRPTKPGQSRLDNYDYAMHGKVFKIDKEANEKMCAMNNAYIFRPRVHFGLQTFSERLLVGRALFVSFGGLLMKLVGDHRNLDGAELDSRFVLFQSTLSPSSDTLISQHAAYKVRPLPVVVGLTACCMLVCARQTLHFDEADHQIAKSCQMQSDLRVCILFLIRLFARTNAEHGSTLKISGIHCIAP